MLLSEFLAREEVKEAQIQIIGLWKVPSGEFIVLARAEEHLFPVPKVFHLIPFQRTNRDPELAPEEANTILRRFGLKEQ